jgi:hypothetical protein
MSSGEKKAIPKKQASILSYLPVPEQAEMKGRPKYVVRTEIAKVRRKENNWKRSSLVS